METTSNLARVMDLSGSTERKRVYNNPSKLAQSAADMLADIGSMQSPHEKLEEHRHKKIVRALTVPIMNNIQAWRMTPHHSFFERMAYMARSTLLHRPDVIDRCRHESVDRSMDSVMQTCSEVTTFHPRPTSYSQSESADASVRTDLYGIQSALRMCEQDSPLEPLSPTSCNDIPCVILFPMLKVEQFDPETSAFDHEDSERETECLNDIRDADSMHHTPTNSQQWMQLAMGAWYEPVVAYYTDEDNTHLAVPLQRPFYTKNTRFFLPGEYKRSVSAEAVLNGHFYSSPAPMSGFGDEEWKHTIKSMIDRIQNEAVQAEL